MSDLSNIQIDNICNEIVYKAVRSSGPGGQHVNKTSTKIELYFDIYKSANLSLEQKEKIQLKLAKKINQEGILILSSQKTKSQIQNKEDVTNRFINLLINSLKEPKKRINTRPTLASKHKRVEDKKKVAQKKTRRKPNFEE